MDLLRSLPLGLYIEQPITWLHRLDPRVKLAWLLSFLVSPFLAGAGWRLLLVGLLIILTLAAAIPLRVWRQQLGWLLFLSVLVCCLTAIMPDGLTTNYQPRLPEDEFAFAGPTKIPARRRSRAGYDLRELWSKREESLSGTPDLSHLPQPTSYRYVLFEQGPVTVTRRSLDLGVRTGTILFTLIYSTNLYLLTTAPEEITTGLESLAQPLRRFRWPITEIVLTLTLSLRFLPLVMEEIQNLVRSVRTRAINWKKLGIRGAVQIWLMLIDRLLANLFLRAEQIASAMQVRGFTSPNQHRVQWNPLRIRTGDWLALGCLGLFWGARLWLGGRT